MDIPIKLQQWSQHRAQPYLAKHAYATFQVDTLRTSWADFSRLNSLPHPWSEVKGSKQKQKQRPKSKVSNPYKKSSSRPSSTPATIPEEDSTHSNNTNPTPTLSGQKRTKDDVSAASSADGKISALIPESDVPVCDGTKRVSFRWKLPIELSRISTQSTEIQKEIHTVVNEFLSDDDGCIYDWNQEGTDPRQSPISKLSPSDLRSYLPSTITISAERQITVQIRFGFFGKTPSKWRSSPSTKEKLEKYEVTVSISNSTSTSGKLVIAGYILLKAPMTTHRIRYLQWMRQELPDHTPPFDILLHKRPPVSSEVIPHLVVQCGHKHVHALSESLCPLLTGDNSALYMPRSIMSDMSDEKVMEFFQQHNAYCRDLTSHPLSPLLRNIDKPRKEHNPNGSLSIERTARDWARSLKAGNSDYHFDVVNGGPDQLAYLIFPSKYADVAAAHVESYRQRLYPRRKRETQFQQDVGPSKTVHLSRRVIANLEFMERLCAMKSSASQSAPPSEPPSVNTPQTSSEADDQSIASGSTTSSVTQASRPLTHLESLRQQLHRRETGASEAPSSENSASEISEGSDRTDETTLASTTSGKSKTSGRMSTSSAKVRQLVEVLQRHKSDTAHSQAKQSERVSRLERELQRVQELDSKLDTIQTDFVSRLNLFEGRMEQSMNSNMSQLLALVQTLTSNPRSNHDPTRSPASADRTALQQINNLDSDGSSTLESSSSKASATSTESTGLIQSPDHKKLKSTSKKSKKNKLKESFRRRLDEIKDSQSPSTDNMDTQAESVDSFDQIAEEMEDLMASDTNSNRYHSSLAERQYTASPDSINDDTASHSSTRDGQS